MLLPLFGTFTASDPQCLFFRSQSSPQLGQFPDMTCGQGSWLVLTDGPFPSDQHSANVSQCSVNCWVKRNTACGCRRFIPCLLWFWNWLVQIQENQLKGPLPSSTDSLKSFIRRLFVASTTAGLPPSCCARTPLILSFMIPINISVSQIFLLY